MDIFDYSDGIYPKLKKPILIENVIPLHIQDEYAKKYRYFNWKYITNTLDDTNPFVNDKVYDVGQLVYKIFHDDVNLLENELDILNILDHKFEPYKIKYNLLWKVSESNKRYNLPHVDHVEKDYISAIYYVVDSDGDTCFFYRDETIRIKPKKGTLVVFPSNILHASSNPIESFERVVINFIIRIMRD